LGSASHATDAASRERNAKHVEVQKTINIHLESIKSLIIIAEEVPTIMTRTCKGASGHCKWTLANESSFKQRIILKILKGCLKLHMSI